jgi:hypothetical protein
MLGIMEQLRYNGLDHSPATRTRRSSCMRVKLQLVLCSDDGQEETVTDVIALNKSHERIEPDFSVSWFQQVWVLISRDTL